MESRKREVQNKKKKYVKSQDKKNKTVVKNSKQGDMGEKKNREKKKMWQGANLQKSVVLVLTRECIMKSS